MSGWSRRGALGALAGAVSLTWARGVEAETSTPRVRPGAPIRLRCAEADAFELQMPDGERARFKAPGGRLSLPAPMIPPEGDADWAEIRCTPLQSGRAVAPALTVEVLAGWPGFGA